MLKSVAREVENNKGVHRIFNFRRGVMAGRQYFLVRGRRVQQSSNSSAIMKHFTKLNEAAIQDKSFTEP